LLAYDGVAGRGQCAAGELAIHAGTADAFSQKAAIDLRLFTTIRDVGVFRRILRCRAFASKSFFPMDETTGRKPARMDRFAQLVPDQLAR